MNLLDKGSRQIWLNMCVSFVKSEVKILTKAVMLLDQLRFILGI